MSSLYRLQNPVGADSPYTPPTHLMAGLTHSKHQLHRNYPEGAARAWIAWSMPALFFLYEFMIRVMPAVIEGPLRKELGVGSAEIGLSMSFYYYAYGPMQIIVGVLLDRFGARSPLSIAAIICAIGAIAFASANSLTGLATGRFLMGFGSAFAYVGTVYVATIWFPGRRIALISGLTVTLGMLGAITAESTLQFMIDATRWQNVMYGFAAVGVVLAILQFIMIPKRPEWFMEHMHASKVCDEKHGICACIKEVLTNRQTLLLGLITGLVYLPLGTFAALWGFHYLKEVLGIDESEAGGIVSIMFVGLAVGGPALGWFSDMMGERKKLVVICTLVGILATSGLLLQQPGHSILLVINLFVLGIVVGVLVLAFPLAMDQNPTYARGTALTFVNLTQMIFAGVGQWVVGMLLDVEAGSGVEAHPHHASSFMEIVSVPLILPAQWLVSLFKGMSPGSPATETSSVDEFRMAFLLLPAAMVVAFILSLFLKEPKPSHGAEMGKKGG